MARPPLTYYSGIRFYSDAVLGSLNRSLGIQQWVDLNYRHVPLERALAAFDMFIPQNYQFDFETVRMGKV